LPPAARLVIQVRTAHDLSWAPAGWVVAEGEPRAPAAIGRERGGTALDGRVDVARRPLDLRAPPSPAARAAASGRIGPVGPAEPRPAASDVGRSAGGGRPDDRAPAARVGLSSSPEERAPALRVDDDGELRGPLLAAPPVLS